MTPPRRPAGREGGFTLVEVLVGALVLGIFISFVYGAVVSAFRVRRVIQTTTSAMASGTMAIDLVARDLENCFWMPIEEGDAFKAVEEGGGLTTVDFLTTTDSRRQEEVNRRFLRSDVTEVGYRTRQGDGGLVLYRREQFGVDGKPLEGGDYFKVIGGVREFLIEWIEEDPEAEGANADAEPVPDWDAKEKKKLPRAARIVLVLEGQSTDPARADETVEFRFERWVALPGMDDQAPKAQGGEDNPPGGGG